MLHELVAGALLTPFSRLELRVLFPEDMTQQPAKLGSALEALVSSLELFDPMPGNEATREAWRARLDVVSLAMQRGLRSGTLTNRELRLPVSA